MCLHYIYTEGRMKCVVEARIQKMWELPKFTAGKKEKKDINGGPQIVSPVL